MKTIWMTIVLLFGLASSPAMSQEAVPEQAVPEGEVDLLSAEVPVIGTTITIDEAFAAEHGVEVLAPFSFLVPTAEDIRELLDPAPQPGQALVKVNFATLDSRLIENLQFVPLTVSMGDPEERMNTLASLLANDAYQTAVGTREAHQRDLVRAIKVGEYDAVEVIGRYEDEVLGLMYLRIVGILNPDSEHSVAAIANVVSSIEPIPAPNDFFRTRGGAALSNFAFLTE